MTEEKIEGMGLNPVVTLVITDLSGKVKLLEKVGESNLSHFLKLASKLEDNPIREDSYLLDCRGQEIYILEDFSYFKSITGFFLSCPDSREIVKLCSTKDLHFSFIVSY
tara:strand:+ start:3952 stop:4278 length:327 start_codon:yes stop_codon:yes gene_type:complete